jgi:hypothetical protein
MVAARAVVPTGSRHPDASVGRSARVRADAPAHGTGAQRRWAPRARTCSQCAARTSP